MADMVERVGLAIYRNDHADIPDWTESDTAQGWCDPDSRALYCSHARVAIEAMREPTEAMLLANEAHACGASRDDVIADYQSMIDAALNTSEG